MIYFYLAWMEFVTTFTMYACGSFAENDFFP